MSFSAAAATLAVALVAAFVAQPDTLRRLASQAFAVVLF